MKKEHKVIMTIVECAWCGTRVRLDPATNDPVPHDHSVCTGSHLTWKACSKPKGA